MIPTKYAKSGSMPQRETFERSILKFNAGTKICADIGAGISAFSQALKEDGAYDQVVAIDLSPDCISICKENGLDTREGTVEDSSGSLDAIVCNDLVGHF